MKRPPIAVKRALLMASGANRGAYYAGFGKVFDRHSLDFELMAGVSAGALASGWFAAGQFEDIIASWRAATTWRISPHPVFNSRRRLNVDALIQQITLRMMDVERARTSSVEVRLGAARVSKWRLSGLPRADFHVFSSRQARDEGHLGLMMRASGFVPVMNGLRTAIAIDGEQFVDGGVVARVPFEMVPEGHFDELWVAACSPHGLEELENRLERWDRPERLVVVTPSIDLPVGRWSLDWTRIQETIDVGRADIETAIEEARKKFGNVFVGRRAGRYRDVVEGGA